MFDTVILGRSCPKQDYDTLAPRLRMNLFEAQRQCRENGIPLLILVCGLEGSGRGEVTNLLSEWMDGKFLQTHVFWDESDEEKARPLAWRFWRCLPAKGETAVFFDGWYGTILRSLFAGSMDMREFYERAREFKGMEDSLALSGTVLVKLWLHLDKKTWKKRIEERLNNRSVRRYAPLSLKIPKYDDVMEAASETITLTDRQYAPWAIIDAKDDNFRNLSVARAIIEAVNRAVSVRAEVKRTVEIVEKAEETTPKAREVTRDAQDAQDAQDVQNAQASQNTGADDGARGTVPAAQDAPTEQGEPGGQDGQGGHGDPLAHERNERDVSHVLEAMSLTTLEAVDLTRSLPHEDYKTRLKALQKELRELTYLAWKKGISSTLLFEGMDASGKGGTIRRITKGVDARIIRVIPISSPTDEELSHHYLWRFWRHVPKAGFVTIYDRSWYGRVLVERVENLTPQRDWSRAYAEINHFERALVRGGNILLKFWLHISPEEELRRFEDRENTPWKRYKITPEDWRNRARWDDYMTAADEMFLRTSTNSAPWHIVPAEDKKFARVEALKIYRDALVEALGKEKKRG